MDGTDLDFWLEVAAQDEADALDRDWAGAGFGRRNEESAGVQLEFDFGEVPAHDYNMPHDVRYYDETFGDFADGGCPPNCPRRLAMGRSYNCIFCHDEGDCVECDPETGWK